MPQPSKKWMFVPPLITTVLLASLCLPGFAAAAADQNLVVAISQDTDTQDPARSTDLSSVLIAGQVFDTLTTLPANSQAPQPGIASSWGVSADGLTWTFHLRTGISFQDSTPFNAAAVVANFQRWWDPLNAQ